MSRGEIPGEVARGKYLSRITKSISAWIASMKSSGESELETVVLRRSTDLRELVAWRDDSISTSVGSQVVDAAIIDYESGGPDSYGVYLYFRGRPEFVPRKIFSVFHREAGGGVRVHYLKSWESLFRQAISGAKPFEIRKDDRCFEVGDVIVLQEYDPEAGVGRSGETGLQVKGVVTSVVRREDLPDPARDALGEGYVVLGISWIPSTLSVEEEVVP